MKPLPATGPKLIGINAFASVERRIDREVLSIGAADSNDLVLAHKSVSGRHAEIRRTRDGCIVRDLGSTNGTYLNGKRIEGEQILRPGDEVRFGAARFALVAGEKGSSSIARIIGPALGLMMLAALGFLSIRFVRNWDNLEQLPSQSEHSVASVAAGREAAPMTSSSDAHVAASAGETKSTVPMPAWLAAINSYRAAVHLAAVNEDAKLSDADRKHSTYIVKNYEDKVSPGHLIGAEMHEEAKGNPWFTPEGQAAGAQSDVNQLWGYENPPSPLWAIETWLAGPFHRLWMLNPQLQRVGYGELCEKKYCVAALDLGSGIDASSSSASLFATPIEFPPDKSTTGMKHFSGEWPSPLTSCPGYRFPAGLPATIELGANVDAKLSDYQITLEGRRLESCGIDAGSYQNPVATDQERGRSILHALGAAMIVPRVPLQPGHYSVTATLNGHSYQWSFTAAAD